MDVGNELRATLNRQQQPPPPQPQQQQPPQQQPPQTRHSQPTPHHTPHHTPPIISTSKQYPTKQYTTAPPSMSELMQLSRVARLSKPASSRK